MPPACSSCDPTVRGGSDHCPHTDPEPTIRRVADWIAVLSLGVVLAVVGGALSALWILYVVDSLR